MQATDASQPANSAGVLQTFPSCNSAASCAYVSLGSGGSITLEFVDNRLTGSGSSALDLWIFEVGSDVEDTFIEISKDGLAFSNVGKVFGATAGIDIDAFGFGPDDQFRYVRLTDDPAEGRTTSATVGADIDSVGAISTVAVPEAPTWLYLMCGAVPLLLRRRVVPAPSHSM
jgi:hypothetical protein